VQQKNNNFLEMSQLGELVEEIYAYKCGLGFKKSGLDGEMP
jgi:hypothetical protein